ncbi:MAG: cytochrome P450, partial [Anaerolineae bacterium]|nr:cytochrome P450 [Anaerolineae bacterium]
MEFSPLSPEFQANPYPVYEMLRANAPIFYWEQWGITFLTRYEDCAALLKDSRFGHEILNVMTREQLGLPPEPPQEY